ncbi:variable surface protein [Plasmodium gonderi]|uniref:Variable surface protein n=1 Tax=Plasmodium gonderi TaxID=77519 RepID=A0A1Y1JQ09_PLAGO|nr:variable surface protein [Plasmodium gonderi]GAW84571.1 variable surface protein [Plasmodium gonderi]
MEPGLNLQDLIEKIYNDCKYDNDLSRSTFFNELNDSFGKYNAIGFSITPKFDKVLYPDLFKYYLFLKSIINDLFVHKHICKYFNEWLDQKKIEYTGKYSKCKETNLWDDHIETILQEKTITPSYRTYVCERNFTKKLCVLPSTLSNETLDLEPKRAENLFYPPTGDRNSFLQARNSNIILPSSIRTILSTCLSLVITILFTFSFFYNFSKIKQYLYNKYKGNSLIRKYIQNKYLLKNNDISALGSENERINIIYLSGKNY